MLEQQKLIQAVQAKGAQDQAIDAILMYGSFTQCAGDKYSDVEFYLFVDDDHFSDFDSLAWITDLHPIFNHFFNEHGTEVVIFTNLVRGEFHFLPKSQLPIINSFTVAGYFPDLPSMLLFDRQGDLQTALQVLADYQPDLHNRATAEHIVNNLLNNLLFAINVFKRGELARAQACMQAAQHYYLQAVRLLESQTQHWLNPLKALEQEISPEHYQAYASFACALEHDAVFRALQNLLREGKLITQKLNALYGANQQQRLYRELEHHLGE